MAFSKIAYLCESLSNGTPVINRGWTTDIKEGMVFIIPDGTSKEIKDPLSGKLLGCFQYELGRVKVWQVFSDYSLCTYEQSPAERRRVNPFLDASGFDMRRNPDKPIARIVFYLSE